MRKQLLHVLLIASFCFLIGTAYYDNSFPIIKVVVNGKELVPTDVPAVIINGRAMVPLRMIAEALEADVNWDQATNTVNITKKADVPRPDPQKELIEVLGIKTRTYQSNVTEVSGYIKNSNDNWVYVRLTIYFYNPINAIIDHIHLTDEIGPGRMNVFYRNVGNDLERYDHYEVYIDELKWAK